MINLCNLPRRGGHALQGSSSFVQVLRGRAELSPDEIAYIFLPDGEEQEISVTYGELDLRARAWAIRLQQRFAPGSRAVLLFPSGLDFIAAFFGCLYAGLVAVPCPQPRSGGSRRNYARLEAIMRGAQPSVMLGPAAALNPLRVTLSGDQAFAGIEWLSYEPAKENLAEKWNSPGCTPDTLALLQFTSGSTGSPKGVMVTHGNLLHNQLLMQEAFQHGPSSIVCGWLPMFHDMGLVGNVLHPVYLGLPCVLMTPLAFLQRPVRWLQAISRYRATTSGGPNFAYDLCVRKIAKEDRAGLDLSCWTAAFNGAEPVQAHTLASFSEGFEGCHFRASAFLPCYGLAEATLMVSGAHWAGEPRYFNADQLRQGVAAVAESKDEDARPLAASGPILGNQQAIIVDPETNRPTGDGRIGEVWLQGPSVATGYWGESNDRDSVFQATLNGSDGPRFLRTGDLGFIHNRQLFITSRLKDLIIVRGRNYYPQDIELTAELSHGSAQQAAAFSAETQDGEGIVVVQEMERGWDTSRTGAVIDSIRSAIAAEHDVLPFEVLLVRARSLPRTTSGKLRRNALRDSWLAGELEALASWRRTAAEPAPDVIDREALLLLPSSERTAAITQALQFVTASLLCIAPESVATDLVLTSFGFDSLAMVELNHRVQTQFGVILGFTTILDNPTLATLAKQIASCMAEEVDTAIELPEAGPTEDSVRYYPLSHGQLALLYLHQLAPESAAYNIARAVKIEGSFDPASLRRAFANLVQRHPALRTTFPAATSEPMQAVRSVQEVDFQEIETQSWTDGEHNRFLLQESHRIFDLANGPLLRIRLLHTGEQTWILLLVVHHIVADFWSLAVFWRELMALYNTLTASLEPLKMSYGDYAMREREEIAAGKREYLWEYWRGQLAGKLPVSDLPTDRRRPELQTFYGSQVPLRIGKNLTTRLIRLCAHQGATLFAGLLAAFDVFLARYMGQDEVIIGCPAVGRSRPELASLVGYFVNPLPLRASIADNPGFNVLLGRVRRAAFDALKHADFPFHLMAERLGYGRDASRSPIFQTMLVMQQAPPGYADLLPLAVNLPGSAMRIRELSFTPKALPQHCTQFDLMLVAAQIDDEIPGFLQYNTDLFDESTISRMTQHFTGLLEEMVADEDRGVRDIPLVRGAERDEILYGWNDTAREFSEHDLLLHELIALQMQRTPEAEAVRFGTGSMTFAELDRRSTQLADRLRERGAEPETLVGICVERCLEMIVGMVGILKTGAAYLPIDPSYPAERIRYMLADGAPSALLIHAATRHVADGFTGNVFDLDAEAVQPVWETQPAARTRGVPGNPAYVIYTSGSTGRPKGTAIPHSGVVNRLLWMQEAYRLTASDKVLQKTPTSFDVSVWELFWPLISGATLVVAPPAAHKDPLLLSQLVGNEGITVMHFVPSMLRAFLEAGDLERCESLRLVIASGEALSADLKTLFFSKLNVRLENLYGPTEASIDVTFWNCELDTLAGSVPIGRPIANTRIHILDERMQALPLGVAGELYIGGTGLARGYVKRPELTAERFVPDPISSIGGERLYRTGDVARYWKDGVIEFLGRADRQVKVRGNRIELAEVETVLMKHPALREVAVTALTAAKGEMQLAAFATVAGPWPGFEELYRFASSQLPSYMVPSSFTLLESMPLTPSGKLDRNALPQPVLMSATHQYVPPVTPLQEVLVEIWSEVLNVEAAGVDDNFFELGGDSLRAIAAVAGARAKGLNLSLPDILRFQTIRDLAHHLEIQTQADIPHVRRDPFTLLSEADRARLPEGLEDAFPMSVLQQGLFFHAEFGADYEIYVTTIHLRARFDEDVLREALQRVIVRHPILRTSFDFTRFSEPVQLVHPDALANLETHDLRTLRENERSRHFAEWIEEEKVRKFDWSRQPLVRVTVHRHSEDDFHLTLAEPFLDGWSAASLLSELLRGYTALLEAPVAPEPPLAASFADFVALEREALASETSHQFWNEMLDGSTCHHIPSWGERANSGPINQRIQFQVSEETVAGLRKLCHEARAPIKSAVLAAHVKAMSVFSGVDVLTGLIANGRPEIADGDRVLGIHLNALPFRIRHVGGTWLELVRTVFDAERALLPHRRYPIAELQRQRGRQALFEAVFNFTHFRVYSHIQQSSGAEILDGYASEQTYFPLTVHCNVGHTTGNLLLALDYNSRLFSHTQVRHYAEWHLRILEAMAMHPGMDCESFCVLTEGEQSQVIHDWNQTEREVRGGCLHDRMERQAELSPNALALIWKEQRFTYAELHARANRLAGYLRHLGVRQESRVGICMDRTDSMVISILAVLKAGGAYVPLDPAYPAERLRFVVEDAGLVLMLTRREFRDRLPESLHCLLLEEESALIETYPYYSVQSGTSPENAAYVLYTSGSTGNPKGVILEHRQAMGFLDWVLAEFRREWLDKVLFSTSICFDLSIMELFAPLLCGGTVILAENALALASMPRASNLTLLNTVPSAIVELMRIGGVPETVKTIALAGEPLPGPLLNRIYENTAVERVYNLYGLTELTTYSTSAMVAPGTAEPSIGKPIFNTTAYVLDRQRQPLPIGVPGELFVGGDMISRCYHNRPDLTAMRFIPDPFSSKPGARLFATGDQVRWMPDGTLDFLGRLDYQVKIRGFRIEPGETETVLGRHPKVSSSVVVAREGFSDNDARLVGYVVPNQGATVTAAELREFLAEKIPAHQVPSDFVVLEALPLTPNGKVNRLALPAPRQEETTARAERAAPRDAVEEQITAIWEELLQRSGISVFDNFFELGGHSLLATQATARLRALFAIDLPLPALFQAPTIAELGQVIQSMSVPAESEVELEALLAELDQLSDEEVRMQLKQTATAGGGR
jgi:amino acid adenylation domain-containing protein